MSSEPLSRCSCSEVPGENDPTTLALRLGGAAIILVVSGAASSFPTLVKHVPRIEPPAVVFFIGKHFGTGVILSTAFVHLLQEGFESLTNPCLSGNWKDWTGFLVLLSFLVIFLVEYISTVYVERISTADALQSHSRMTSSQPFPPYHDDPTTESPADMEHQSEHLSRSVGVSSIDDNHTSHDHRLSRSVRTHSRLSSMGHHRHESPSSHQHKAGPRLSYRSSIHLPEPEAEEIAGGTHSHAHGPDLMQDVSRKTRIIGILVLQLGIMLHSLVIGLTLSITAGADFTTLFTAVVFHQLFEGLSLGIRISTLPSNGSHKTGILPVILCVLFAITAPVGVILGIIFLPSHPKAIQSNLFLLQQFQNITIGGGGGSSEVQTGLLTQGLMCALSAGMLIYAAAVEMLAGDFVMDPEMRQLGIGKQILGLGSLMLGVIAMAIIG